MLKHRLLREESLWLYSSDGTVEGCADWSMEGPDPILTWGHGSACVFPQDAESLIWIPEWLVRPMDGSPDHQPWPTGTMGAGQESSGVSVGEPG